MIYVYAYDQYHNLTLSIVVSQDTAEGEVVQAVFVARGLNTLHYQVVCDSLLYVTDQEGQLSKCNGYPCTKWTLKDVDLKAIIDSIAGDFGRDLITVVRKEVA